METRANHILVGSFVIVVVLLTLASILWLGKFGDDGNTAQFDILFSESVIGLGKGSMVSYNGVPVGEVESLAVDTEDLARVLVRVRITGRDLIRADTVVTLGFAAVTGVADIRLSGGSNESPRLYDAETVPVIIASPSPLAKLTASGQDIMVNLNEVAARLTDLLSEGNVAHVRTVLGNVEALTTSLASERESLAMALHQLAQASSQVEGTLEGIEAAARSVHVLIDEDARELLATSQATMLKLDALTVQLDGLVTDNRAAIAGFSQQGLNQVAPALAELRATVVSLQQLTEQLSRSRSPLLGSPQPKEFKPR